MKVTSFKRFCLIIGTDCPCLMQLTAPEQEAGFSREKDITLKMMLIRKIPCLKTFILMGMLLPSLFLSGQVENTSGKWEPENRNVLHLSTGFGGIFYHLSLGYEYMLRCPDRSCANQFGIRALYGRWILWSDRGDDLSLMGTWQRGRRNNHFEAGGGLLLRYDRSFYQGNYGGTYWRGESIEDPKRIHCTSLMPACYLGYRYQRPQGGFMFRAGGGWPEALYLGVGYSF